MGARPTAWYAHYPADFMAATRHLTLEERGAYRELLDHQFLHESIPSDIKRMSLILGVSPQKTRKLWQVLSHFFQEKDGAFYNKRMEKEISKTVEISEKRAEAAKKRWDANAEAKADANAYTAHNSQLTYKDKDQEIGKKTARKTRLPADWVPSQKLLDYCRDKRPDLDPQVTFEDFRDYYVSHGKTMADWDLTAMRWVRNERTNRNGAVRPNTRTETASQRSDRIARELAASLE